MNAIELSDGASGNRSVGRALDIMVHLASAPEPLPLAELARGLELPKSSALMLLRALASRGFVTQDGSGRYALGVATFALGASYLRTMTPVRSIEPELRILTDELGVTSHFAVLDGDNVVYLAKNDPPDLVFGLASSLGARLPAARTAVGKAQVAHSWPQSQIETHGVELVEAVTLVRKRGYAVDEGETAVGIRCIAAPIFDATGCAGAVGVSMLLQPNEHMGSVIECVTEAARRASNRLGGVSANRGSA